MILLSKRQMLASASQSFLAHSSRWWHSLLNGSAAIVVAADRPTRCRCRLPTESVGFSGWIVAGVDDELAIGIRGCFVGVIHGHCGCFEVSEVS